MDAAQFQKPGKRSKPDVAGDQMEQGWSRERQRVTRVAASQTKWKLEGSQCVLRNRRRYPMPRSGEGAYIEIKPAATGERSGSPDMWLCRRQGHTHTSHRYWRKSQKMDNKRGFGEARGKMHVLGELLGWRRGGLQGLVVGMRKIERESSKGGDQRSEQEQHGAKEGRRDEQRSCCCFECFV